MYLNWQARSIGLVSKMQSCDPRKQVSAPCYSTAPLWRYLLQAGPWVWWLFKCLLLHSHVIQPEPHRCDLSIVSVPCHFHVSTVCKRQKKKSLSSTLACGAEGLPLISSAPIRGASCSTVVSGPRGWGLLSAQEGKMAFSAFVGIVALLTTLQTQGRQKDEDINGSLLKDKTSGRHTEKMEWVLVY